MDEKKITDYYDNFVHEQKESGINDRIYKLYTRCLQLGLNVDSNVLELGCGIGALTFLLSHTVKTGKIEAVDISPESIRISKEKINRPNVSFFTGDIVSYQPNLEKIDFIILFDIIEHIPIARHDQLFQNLASICKEETRILINIPNPEYIKYDMINNPQALQIIDQPLPLNFILGKIDTNNLELAFFETYSIWVEKDYQFFVITAKKDFKEIRLSERESFWKKVAKKIQRVYVRMRYRYK